MHTIASLEESARTLALTVHAAQHAQATADRTSAHYVWLQAAGGEPELYRQYPMQGLRVRQSDVTIFARGGQ